MESVALWGHDFGFCVGSVLFAVFSTHMVVLGHTLARNRRSASQPRSEVCAQAVPLHQQELQRLDEPCAWSELGKFKLWKSAVEKSQKPFLSHFTCVFFKELIFAVVVFDFPGLCVLKASMSKVSGYGKNAEPLTPEDQCFKEELMAKVARNGCSFGVCMLY